VIDLAKNEIRARTGAQQFFEPELLIVEADADGEFAPRVSSTCADWLRRRRACARSSALVALDGLRVPAVPAAEDDAARARPSIRCCHAGGPPQRAARSAC
jgi:hypothetical protein